MNHLTQASVERRRVDPQQRRLYNSEREVVRRLGKGRSFSSIEQMQTYVNELLDSRAVVERFGTKHVHVGPGVERRALGGYGSISMPSWSWHECYVLHEVAHCIADGHHGTEFCGVLRFLFEIKLGNTYARAFADEMFERDVDYDRPPAADRSRWVRHVERKKQKRAESITRRKQAALRQQSERQRPPTRSEATEAAAALRRAVKAGTFGEAASKSRRRALDVARIMESLAR